MKGDKRSTDSALVGVGSCVVGTTVGFVLIGVVSGLVPRMTNSFQLFGGLLAAATAGVVSGWLFAKIFGR